MSRDQGLADWPDLEDELERWTSAGQSPRLWWRDDDAVAASAALDRLLSLATRFDAPLSLAVIPSAAEPSLTDAIGPQPGVRVLQHGYAHRNHAAAEAKKSEYPAERPAGAAAAEWRDGFDRLRRQFGDRFVPVFVPPWNRIAPHLAAALPEHGFVALSGFGDRLAPSGLPCCNAHVDPLDWLAVRSRSADRLAAPLALGQLTAALSARRTGVVDRDRPIGLLTHHRVHDEAVWAFVERLLARLTAQPGWVVQDLSAMLATPRAQAVA